jgi:hypothetical protein
MRKVFVVLFGLILSSLLVSCSEDTTTVTPPTPEPEELDISTTALPVGYTCTPYNVELGATGGTAPYTWALAAGSDPLPAGLSLTADGTIIGLLDAEGEYTIIVQCTDNAETPETDTQQLTITIDIPSNPSFAIFFDDEASDCSAATEAMTILDCYVFIMLEGSDWGSARAAEFKIRITNSVDADLTPGGDYAIINTQYPSYVSIPYGDLFDGMSIAFNRPVYGPTPIHVATFGLLLIEDFDQLSFKFDAHPETGSMSIVDEEYNMYQASGRESAINY